FFNEFAVRLPANAADIVEALAQKGVLAGVPGGRLWPDEPALENILVVAATECVSEDDINAFAAALEEVVS
ncbi:MAG: glycine dehydrogenase, partial [Planctomycetota bacterium]